MAIKNKTLLCAWKILLFYLSLHLLHILISTLLSFYSIDSMINVQAVSKWYGHLKAVENISFQLSANEIIGFVGPNGAGKSTVLKMLATYLLPTQGTITIDGLNVATHSLSVRRKIGYLSGDTPLYQAMRVDKFLTFCGKARGLKGQELTKNLEWVIDICGLSPHLFKRVNQCSTGFRQRIGLGAALIHDPPILLLDEPTHGFDPLQVQAFRDLLYTLKKDRVILLAATSFKKFQPWVIGLSLSTMATS